MLLSVKMKLWKHIIGYSISYTCDFFFLIFFFFLFSLRFVGVNILCSFSFGMTGCQLSVYCMFEVATQLLSSRTMCLSAIDKT